MDYGFTFRKLSCDHAIGGRWCYGEFHLRRHFIREAVVNRGVNRDLACSWIGLDMNV